MDFRKLFPENANNNYVGHKFALWGFILFTCVMTWRSVVHMFFEQYGFHQIANFQVISGDPDPMLLIYRFFSLWGASQLLFCLVCWVVVFKYKSLIPLMNVFWLIDWGIRLFVYPLIRVDIGMIGTYTTNNTPGIDGAPVAFGITAIVFLLSVANKRNK